MKVSILEENDIAIDRTYMWSDSTTVFDKKQGTFVANRIREILENPKLREWNDIPGAQNPAKLGTRGLRANEMATSV